MAEFVYLQACANGNTVIRFAENVIRMLAHIRGETYHANFLASTVVDG
jgi:hypothetical protein